MRKNLGIAAALGLVLAGGLAVSQGSAAFTGRAFTGQAGGGLRFDGFDVDLPGHRVTLHGVALDGVTPSGGSYHVYARLLTVPLTTPSLPLVLAQWPGTGTAKDEPATHSGVELKIPGQAAATASTATGSASASDVTIVTAANTYLIKKIDLTGTSLSNGDLLALFDPKSQDSLESRFEKVSAKSVIITEVISDKKLPDATIHGVMTGVRLGDVGGGRIGTAAVAGFTVTGLGVKGAGAIKIGAIDATGLDLALLDRVIKGRRSDDTEALKPLADSLTIHDIVVTNTQDQTAIGVALMTEKGLKARPLKTDFKALQEAARQDPPPPGPEGGDEVRAARTKAIAQDIANSFEAQSFAIEKTSLATVNENGAVNAGIGSIAFEGYKDHKLGTLAIRGFLLDGPRVKASFAAFDLASVVLPVLDKPAGSESGALATDSLPAVAKADLKTLAVEVETQDPDAPPSKVKFAIAHIGTSNDKAASGLVTTSAITLDHVTFDLPPGGRPVAKELLAMGYKSLDLSGSESTIFDQDAATLNVQKFNVNGVGLGSVTLAVDLANVTKGILSANPAIQKASALAMLLKRVDVRLENAGFFDKAIAYKAAQDGISVAEERSSAGTFFADQIPAMLGGDPGLKTAGAAVAKFIAAPKNLHISISAKDGLGAADIGLMGNPLAILSRLDIHAEANQ